MRILAAYYEQAMDPAVPEHQTISEALPTYQPPFVGREQELRQLQALFDGAAAGHGALIAITGEPGIGKTSLCEQLAEYVTSRGGQTLVGHCYEEGSLSMPYLPFVESLGGYVLNRDVDALRAELGAGAADVARIVPEVNARMTVELRPAGDPEDDRWRLQQAVIGFLRNASSVRPILLVLEDLHDADRGTLDLLVHVGRNLQHTRTLVVSTYRQVEVDRAHPLSATLAELRRSAQFQRLLLRGLTAEHVQRLLSKLGLGAAATDLAEPVHRQTEGNPLFVLEVARFLTEEGLITGASGGGSAVCVRGGALEHSGGSARRHR